jgi:hypothetical protein
VTDEAGNQRRYTYDVFGHMTKVEEPNPTLSTPLVTTYKYFGFGPLYQSNQSGPSALSRSNPHLLAKNVPPEL